MGIPALITNWNVNTLSSPKVSWNAIGLISVNERHRVEAHER
jgi:hypothetical protein